MMRQGLCSRQTGWATLRPTLLEPGIPSKVRVAVISEEVIPRVRGYTRSKLGLGRDAVRQGSCGAQLAKSMAFGWTDLS